MKTLLLSLLLLLPGWVAAQSDADLLEPDKAFQVTSRLEGGDRVEVTYRIADGYYLYRDKLSWQAQGAAGAGASAVGSAPTSSSARPCATASPSIST